MKIAYNGRIVQVVEYDVHVGGGKSKTFEKARRAPGVRLIIENERQEILLNKEFRYELDAFDWRLPGGKVFDSLVEYENFLDSGEEIFSPVLEAAKREGREEAGIDVKSSRIMQKSICGATMEWDLYYIKVDDFGFMSGYELEEGEVIDESTWFSYDELQRMIVKGDIQEGRSATVLAQIVFG